MDAWSISIISVDANGRARTFSGAEMRRPVGDALIIKAKELLVGPFFVAPNFQPKLQHLVPPLS
jgi:hypothetical protein